MILVFGDVLLYICFYLEENLNLKSNELVITPMELSPMRAPAIDGVKIVPFMGNNTPAVIRQQLDSGDIGC